jgi:hypothetical protein
MRCAVTISCPPALDARNTALLGDFIFAKLRTTVA